MNIKYKYIKPHPTFFVLLLWKRTWSKLSVNIKKIIKKIPLLKLLFPIVLYVFRKTFLKQAYLQQLEAAWMQVALWVTAQECMGMSTLSYFRYPLHWGPTQTDWLSITSPKISSPWHLHCSSPCPRLLSFTRPVIDVHQLLLASCQSQGLLLCSCWRSRTCSTRHNVLLGSVLLQCDPQHHLSSPLVTTITYVIGITGELTSTLLLLLLLVNTASCCCSLFYKVSSDLLSTQLSTSSSMITFVLCTAQHKLVLLIRSRGEMWSEETQSHLSE